MAVVKGEVKSEYDGVCGRANKTKTKKKGFPGPVVGNFICFGFWCRYMYQSGGEGDSLHCQPYATIIICR